MFDERYTYLLLDLASVSVPLLRSFEPRLRFAGEWKRLLPAIGLVAALFIAWDVWFTHIGVWRFNERYVTGAKLLGLPLEEWLFFFCIPYACLFVYALVKRFLKRNPLEGVAVKVTAVLAVVLFLAAIGHGGKAYTFWCCLLAGVALAVHASVGRFQHYLPDFYVAYLICLLPFFAVNGLLTSLPVVIYNTAEFAGLRLGSIPAEDAVYCLLLLLLVTAVYEYRGDTT